MEAYRRLLSTLSLSSNAWKVVDDGLQSGRCPLAQLLGAFRHALKNTKQWGEVVLFKLANMVALQEILQVRVPELAPDSENCLLFHPSSCSTEISAATVSPQQDHLTTRFVSKHCKFTLPKIYVLF